MTKEARVVHAAAVVAEWEVIDSDEMEVEDGDDDDDKETEVEDGDDDDDEIRAVEEAIHVASAQQKAATMVCAAAELKDYRRAEELIVVAMAHAMVELAEAKAERAA
jgi:hypothetical protein